MAQKKSPIPTLKKEELLSRAFRIKPLTHNDDGKLCFREPCDLQSVAFTWDPKPAEEAPGMQLLQEITTFHNYGAPALFKPDIGEVLAQIPPELLDKVTGFTTEPNYANQFAEGGSYHRAITTLYTGELPNSQKNAPVIYNDKKVYPSPAAEKNAGNIEVMKPIKLKKGPQL